MTDPRNPTLRIERHTLDNGLRVVLHPDDRLPLVAINLWYHVGSKHDQPGRTGLAHLFEHVLFEGSAHVAAGEHFRLVQRAGGVANGSTWYDRTNYHETLPAHHLDLGLWLEADRMGFLLPALDQEKLDTQRDVVLNERRQRIDNQPYGRAAERVFELLFADDHPYRWPVIGYVDDLERATLDDVRDFFRTHYVPGNAVLTLAGALDPDHALERVARFFGDIPPGRPPPLEVPAAALADERREVMPDRVQLPRIYLAYHAPAFGTEAWYAGDLWSTALSAGKASVLYEDLVYRRQLAQDAGCFLYPTEESAVFLIFATARPGVAAGRLEEAIDEHLRRAVETPLAESDVARARSHLLTGFYDELQRLERRADRLSSFATYFDDPAAFARVSERYARVTGEDVRAFAADCCGHAGRVVLTVVPATADGDAT